ncbi:centromere protein U isoform X3 [Psammomys obesus]|uniref:centromere protein U isoform X3 n=1 Tax=Psammomys obesus TaxID=48139 RepID=UPI0024528970|nr:centromere protein U isoform X3 [Psammomys obesus]
MVARKSLRHSGGPGPPESPGSAIRTKSALKRAHSSKHKADQKHKPNDVFAFPNNSDVSSILGEMEEEEPYEFFDPPLHSTAIEVEEELSKHRGASASPATLGGRESRNVNPSESEASGTESIKNSTKKPRRKPKPVSSEPDSSEDDQKRRVKSADRTVEEPHRAVPPAVSSAPPEKPEERATPRRTRPHSTRTSAVEEAQAAHRQLKTQKKVRLSPGRRKKSRREGTDSGASETMHIWCLEGKRCSDIMELDVILSVFEKTFLEYKQRVDSEICNQAINKFYFKIKEELVRMLKEGQVLMALKRKNAKIIADMDKKRRRLVEVQDELLRYTRIIRMFRRVNQRKRKSMIRLASQLFYLKQEAFWEPKNT